MKQIAQFVSKGLSSKVFDPHSGIRFITGLLIAGLIFIIALRRIHRTLPQPTLRENILSGASGRRINTLDIFEHTLSCSMEQVFEFCHSRVPLGLLTLKPA